MDLWHVLVISAFMGLLVFLVTWYDLTYSTTRCDRKIFETWAKLRGLNLNYTSHYTNPQTQLAWEAFKHGLRVPR